MFDFLYSLPLAVTGPIFVLSLCLGAAGGLYVVRRWVLPRLRIRAEDSDFSGTMVQSVMVFYGLAVALIAVSVWQTYSDVSKIVSQEATQVAALYRDVSGYPEPMRSVLQKVLRDYVDYIIREAWPLQRAGKIPGGGVERMNQFQSILIGHEPVTEGQKILHGEALRAYNQMILARRLRLDAVQTALPPLLWVVILFGAFISLSTAFFFKVEDARLHVIFVMMLAAFVGLVIFMIFALDRPFHGDLGLSPAPYQLIYDQLMQGNP